MTKSWHLSRRTYLQGTGVALGLPFLNSMLRAAEPTSLPCRMACVYFPFGVAMPADNSQARQWGWFPTGSGKDYEPTKIHESLKPLRDEITFLGGLSHPRCRSMGGHDTGDTFLTGAPLKGSQLTNALSLDQFAAGQWANQTRFPSLVLSSDGGVGEPTRATTLSFNNKGRPIPALASPAQIFARLFGADEATDTQRRKLHDSASMLDRVLEHARSLKNQLGTQDREKLEEYLASVRQVEQQVRQSQRWLDIPKPKVDAADIAREADPTEPKVYLRTMYDLMFLAFQTDSTRIATYMIGQVAGATTVANAFPACIGLSGNWHGLAHGAGTEQGAEKLGRFDQFLAEHFAHFLQRLKNAPEGDGTLLDRTLVFYGSSNSRTHQNINYPLILAGGRKLGLRHGQFLKFKDSTPLANLFVTMLDRLGLRVDRFADSTAEISEVVAS